MNGRTKFSVGAVVASLLLQACSQPLPPDRLQYAGEWRGTGMYLLILADGTVSYERLKDGGRVGINAPLKSFDGDNFIVGVAFLTTTFEVSQPPTETEDGWTMVVDGVTLTRVDVQAAARPAPEP